MSANQVVLITGANQGLGFAAVQQIAALPGWTVLLGARDPIRGKEAVEKITAAGPVSEVELVVLDVTSDASIDAAAKHIEEKFGRLDVLVVRTSHLVLAS